MAGNHVVNDIQRCGFLLQTGRGHLAAPLATALVQQGAARKKVPPAEAPASKPGITLNVRDFGALGDGKTKDTMADAIFACIGTVLRAHTFAVPEPVTTGAAPYKLH